MLCNSFAVDSEAGLGSRDEWDDFGGCCCMVVEVFYDKGVGMYIHLSCPWQEVVVSGVILVTFNM